MEPLRPGEPFGRYLIEDLLGSGGMGQVYRARDTELQRLVALKVLRSDPERSGEDSARAKERLFREARAAAALDHANAVSIFDMGEVNGTPFIAMELIAGRSLRAFVGDPLVPTRERVRWLVDIARALAAAHTRGLVHRDVKPDNVMLREDGTIKVLDFGIARRSAGAGSSPSGSPAVPQQPLTREGSIVGTPLYMAPEQLRGETVDARADQFAWGVVAYELLTGRRPWTGDEQSYEVVASILSGEVRPLRELSPEVPAAVERVVSRTLEKEPAQRFTRMDDVVAALLPFATGESVLAHAPTVEGPSAPFLPGSGKVVSGGALTATQRSFARGRSPSGKAILALAGATSILVAGWVTLVTLRSRSRAAAPAPAPVPEARILRVTDQPVPESSVVAARAAYTTALQGVRDGSVIPAVEAFVQAASLDPLMAAAHLRAHIYGWYYSEAGPEHFQKALDLRGRLSPRDQALTDALSPAYFVLPHDYPESSRRLDALAAQAPNDAELQYIAAMFEADKTRRAARMEAAARMDPGFAAPLWMLASDLMQLSGPNGDSVGELLARCLQVSPISQSCLQLQAARDEALGQCDRMEQDAQLLIARGGGWRSYEHLTRALVARGAPSEALQTALAKKWSTTPPGDVTRPMDLAALAVLRGDFTEAEREVRALEGALASESDEGDHERPAWLHADIETEIGRVNLAAKVADDFLRRRAGWKSEGPYSPRPLFYSFAVRGGLRTEAERQKNLEAWLGDWKIDPWFESQRWIHGYAFPAETKEDALAALAAAPSPVPLVTYHQAHRDGLDAVGRVYLLAGRPHDALPSLREAAATCSALAAPMAHTRANLELGQALEAEGDRAGACAAYAVVLARWGHARPRSVSADTARARSAVLRCGR